MEEVWLPSFEVLVVNGGLLKGRAVGSFHCRKKDVLEGELLWRRKGLNLNLI